MSRTPITVELGGEIRALRYDLNAMVALKEATGINMLNADATMDYSDPGILRAMVWAGLLHSTPLLQKGDVGGWIDLSNMAPVAAKVVEAIASAMGPEVSSEKGNPT